MHNAPLTFVADVIVRVLSHIWPHNLSRCIILAQSQPTLRLAIDCCPYLISITICAHTYRAPYSRVLSLVQYHRVFAVGKDVREHVRWEVGCVCGLLVLGGGRHIRLGLDEYIEK